MKARTWTLFLAVLFVGVVASFAAEDLHTGVWKLNESKSRISPGSPKSISVTYATMGDKVKVIVDGVDADGTPMHTEWTGKFDGKDYPATGDSSSDTWAYRRVNDHTLAITSKHGRSVTMTGLIVVADDGKFRTVNVSGRNAKGKNFSSYSVYDKQ
jgi:hypothetical protein